MERTEPVAVTVSLINMKGGVGKTTIASQLAHAADRDLKVLAVDLDPQSNLSQSIMGIQAYVKHLKDNRPTIAQIFEEYIPAGGDYGSARPIAVDDVIVKKAGDWPNSTLDLIPSRLELSHTLRNPTGKERRLAKALAQVSDRYEPHSYRLRADGVNPHGRRVLRQPLCNRPGEARVHGDDRVAPARSIHRGVPG